ncbi:MAG: hypothetical protein ACREMV_11420 [Gemmatimonadales bacterium]
MAAAPSMAMARARGLLWIGFALAGIAPARAQAPRPAIPPVDSTAVVVLRLADGSELVGRVLMVDDTSLVVVTGAGARAVVPRTAVTSWRRRSGTATATGGYRIADPNTTRLFFGATGRTLARGSGYFADYYLFFPFVAYGFHDRVMASGGVSLVPGASNQLFYIAPKLGVVRGPTFNLAIGGAYATVPGEEDASVGAAYASVTIGPPDAAVTILGGYPFTTEDVSQEPALMVGGDTRIGGASKLLAEVWKLPDVDDVPALFGVRWFGERIAVDFGFLYLIGTDVEGWPLIPWVDFVINW